MRKTKKDRTRRCILFGSQTIIETSNSPYRIREVVTLMRKLDGDLIVRSWKAEECDGDCDYCKYRSTVPGTDERIDREPAYYCSLFEKED